MGDPRYAAVLVQAQRDGHLVAAGGIVRGAFGVENIQPARADRIRRQAQQFLRIERIAHAGASPSARNAAKASGVSMSRNTAASASISHTSSSCKSSKG